jgi:RNA polymerase-binding protein DksA
MVDTTVTQPASLGRLLRKLENTLREEIRAASARAGEQKYLDLAGQVHDSGDEAVADELIEMENTLIERQRHELRAVEAARVRFDQGKINECAACGEEIGFARLLASPVATRCIECQEHYDRTHAHARTPRL